MATSSLAGTAFEASRAVRVARPSLPDAPVIAMVIVESSLA